MSADRSSRWLGHRFEESLVKQAIGQVLARAEGVMPSRILILAASPELEIITRSGLCGILTSAFRGSLELRELSYPVLRDLLVENPASGPLMIIAIGTEKRPAGWPLPDFARWLSNPAMLPKQPVKESALNFSMSGRWLRMDKRGHSSLLETSSADSRAVVQRIGREATPFDFSWGIWSSVRRSSSGSNSGERRVSFETLKIGADSAARIVLPQLLRRRLAEFIGKRGTTIYVSTPTMECSYWMLAESGFESVWPGHVVSVEHSHGWGPSFSLLRFYADSKPGDRMVVMTDLQSIDLLEAGTWSGGED